MFIEEYIKNCVVLVTYRIEESANQYNIEPLGTGFFVLPDGYLITCYHIFEAVSHSVLLLPTNSIIVNTSVQIDNKNQFICEFIENLSNKNKDIAILKVKHNYNRFPYLPLSRLPETSHRIISMYSFGYQELKKWKGHPISGNISGTTGQAQEPYETDDSIFITDSNADKGSSGSPIIDTKNDRVVGLISSVNLEKSHAYAINIYHVFSSWPKLEKNNFDQWSKSKTVNEEIKFKNEIARLYRSQNVEVEIDFNLSSNPPLSIDMLVKSRVKGCSQTAKIAVECLYTDNSILQSNQVLPSIDKFNFAKSENNLFACVIVSNKPFSPGSKKLLRSENVEYETKNSLMASEPGFSTYLDFSIRDFNILPLSVYYQDLRVRKMGSDNEILSNDLLKVFLQEGQSFDRLFFIGGYGSGKTSFCKKTAHDLAIKYKEGRVDRIPVVFNLRHFNRGDNIKSFVEDIFKRSYRVEIPYILFDEYNRAGMLLLIFDALDEMDIHHDHNTICKNISELTSLFHENSKVIITCRQQCIQLQNVQKTFPDMFDYYEIQNFSKEEILNVVKVRRQTDSLDFMNKLSDDRDVWGLAVNPHFLQMVIDVFEKIQEQGPISTPKLIDIYLHEYFTHLQLKRKGRALAINADLANDILVKMAEVMFQKESDFLTEQDIRRILEMSFMERLEKNNITFNRCIETIIGYTLIEHFGRRRWGFKHVSLHNYFTAKSLFYGIHSENKELFNISFLPAETILLIADMLHINHLSKMLKWIDPSNLLLTKYAVIFLGFSERVIERTEMRNTGIIAEAKAALKEVIEKYILPCNNEEYHVIKHAKLSLTILGDTCFKKEIMLILDNDYDYTHKWYALLGIEKLMNTQGGDDPDTSNQYLDVVRKVLNDKDEYFPLRKLAENIIKHDKITR